MGVTCLKMLSKTVRIILELYDSLLKIVIPVFFPSSNNVSNTEPKAPKAEKNIPQQMVFLRPNLQEW